MPFWSIVGLTLYTKAFLVQFRWNYFSLLSLELYMKYQLARDIKWLLIFSCTASKPILSIYNKVYFQDLQFWLVTGMPSALGRWNEYLFVLQKILRKEFFKQSSNLFWTKQQKCTNKCNWRECLSVWEKERETKWCRLCTYRFICVWRDLNKMNTKLQI